jgi:hypothetical protein
LQIIISFHSNFKLSLPPLVEEHGLVGLPQKPRHILVRIVGMPPALPPLLPVLVGRQPSMQRNIFSRPDQWLLGKIGVVGLWPVEREAALWLLLLLLLQCH